MRQQVVSHYSFDVFDTVITRTVLHPKDVFHLMQQRITLELPEIDRLIARRFWGWRVWSEFSARRKAIREDIDLAAVYEVLARLCTLDDHCRATLLDLELQVESEVLTPVGGAAELLDICRCRSGNGIIFLSDMYLPSAFIQSVLERYALFRPGDRLYVSGELGVTKGSGSLFRLLLEQLGIEPTAVIHYGDNLHADYQVPRSLGIGTFKESAKQGSRGRFPGAVGRMRYLMELMQARICIAGGNHV